MEMTLEDGRGELPLSSAPASELEADVALLQESANPSADASSRSRSKKRSASPESDSQTLADDDKTGSDNTTTAAAAAAAVTTADGPVRKARRARKSTYTVRKEETDLLLKEAEVLQARAEALRERAVSRLSEAELLNAILHETKRGQQLSFAVAQSAVSGFLSTEQSNPLHTNIHLGKDWGERRLALLAMKDTKIRNAIEFVQARSQFSDPFKPHHSEERFENANGDYCCVRFDIIQFEGVESVKQVFDSLLFYNLNIEISVSERLGHITVREDYDSVEGSICNYRLNSTQYGVDVETHIVMFAKYFENGHELSGGKPCAVVTLDCVDDDELYPYNPKERARKDVAEAIVLTPHTRKNSENGEEELVVLMTRGKFLKLHRADFEIPPHAVQGLREGMCWGPVMVTTINELLHPEFFSPIAQGNNLCARGI
ncbi:hypothetical protein Gpo141_00012568 [Globisporangium polare]